MPEQCLIIYLELQSPAITIGPPLATFVSKNKTSSLALADYDIHDLSTRQGHNCHGRPQHWWSLTPPSHPYRLRGGCFLLPYCTLTDAFLSEGRRSALPRLSSLPCDSAIRRPTIGCKYNVWNRKLKTQTKLTITATLAS